MPPTLWGKGPNYPLIENDYPAIEKSHIVDKGGLQNRSVTGRPKILGIQKVLPQF